tara:strand:+ start:364 stop:1107 length:744 start_codon:yes stop_codon:yes gene_type:complete
MRIVKVPARNGLGKTEGAEKFCEELCKRAKINDAENLVLDVNNVEDQQKKIYNKGKEIFESAQEGIFLGGDHSISFPLTNAFFEVYEEGRLIIFDAHVDCMQPMNEPSHEEWLRALLEEGIKSERVMIIGAREIDNKEKEYLDRKNVERVSVEEVRKDIESVRKRISEFCAGKETYVSFDMDVFDSDIVKATGYPVKNGLTKEEGLKLVRGISKFRIMGFDIVELHEGKPGFEEELRLAEKVLREVL